MWCLTNNWRIASPGLSDAPPAQRGQRVGSTHRGRGSPEQTGQRHSLERAPDEPARGPCYQRRCSASGMRWSYIWRRRIALWCCAWTRRVRSRPLIALSWICCGRLASATRTHDDKRHGTTSRLAALDVSTGKVIGQLKRRHHSVEFLRFLKVIDAPGIP